MWSLLVVGGGGFYVFAVGTGCVLSFLDAIGLNDFPCTVGSRAVFYEFSSLISAEYEFF